MKYRWETSTDLRTWILVPEAEEGSALARPIEPNTPARFFRCVLEE